MGHSQAALYVHIPFCRRLCPYCDFAVAVRKEPPHEAYCDALLSELNERRPTEWSPRTVYFGGGTPALWSTDALARFLRAVPGIADAEEVTIEANPHDIVDRKLDAWAELGITRISLGVQSFDPDVLAALRRDHDGDLAARAARRIAEDPRFRTSVDLIYASPGATEDSLRSDIERIDTIGPDHVSAYELTVEERTVFGRKFRAGTLGLAPPDERAELGRLAVQWLAERDYERYEVSSFGRAGDIGLHNAGYWLGTDYLGIGLGAHSLRRIGGGVVRRSNVRNLKGYMTQPLAAAEEEALSELEHLGERLFLAARTRIGVSWTGLRDRFTGVDEGCWRELEVIHEGMVRDGLLENDEEILRATLKGLDFADLAAERFWRATATP